MLPGSLHALEGAITIRSLGGSCTPGWGRQLAGSWTSLKWAQAGNLQQQPCQGCSAVNKSCNTLVYCSYSNAEFCRQLEMQPGIWLVCWSIMQCWRRISGQSDHYHPFSRHLYIIMNCCDSKWLVRHQELLCIKTPVISSLLPVITCYYSNNRPIIVLKMDPLLTLTKGPIITHHYPL